MCCLCSIFTFSQTRLFVSLLLFLFSFIVLGSTVCLFLVQYSQRATFIWTPDTAINLNVFAENDHRDRCFFADISGGHRRSIAHGSEHRATRCTNTADPDGLTRWSLVVINKCNTIYIYNVVDKKTVTAMITRRRPPRILAFGHRDTRGSWPPGSAGVRPRYSTARG